MLNIVMPLAGLGSRFRRAGASVPKPLIEVQGMPMAYWALSCVTGMVNDCHVVLVVLRDHVTDHNIAEALKAHIPNADIVVVEKLTGGSLETCMLSRSSVSGNGDVSAPLVALDGDLVFRSRGFSETIGHMCQGNSPFDGALLSFRSSDPRYSFADVQEGAVVRTAEKVAISDHALVGAYAFSCAAEFYKIGAGIVEANERVGNGEFYTSNAYNHLIKRGGRVALAEVDAYWSLGTPEELDNARQCPEFDTLLEEIRRSF